MTNLRASALFCALLVVGAGLLFVWYVRSHGLSARAKPNALEAYLARNVRSLAIDPGVRSLKNPLEPTELNVAEARDHFADHCAVCHANDGSGRTVFGKNMYPPVPDMRGKETQALSDGEIFSVIQNGIRFTGMPGFGGENEENWKLVLLIRRLPKLSAKEIDFMQEINGLEIEAPRGGVSDAKPKE